MTATNKVHVSSPHVQVQVLAKEQVLVRQQLAGQVQLPPVVQREHHVRHQVALADTRER